MRSPIDLQLEQNTLGCIVYENSILIEIADKLKADYFSGSSNKVIYETMMELYANKQPIDLITLNQALKGKRIPVDYVASLADGVVSASSAIHYASLLKDLYVKRQLMALSCESVERIENGEDVNDILGDIMTRSFDLYSNKESNIKPLKNILSKSMNQIEQAYNQKGVIGTSSGLEDIDKILCGFKSKFYVLAGRPGTGKTALALNIAVNSALTEKKILIFELEMPDEEIGIRMLSSESNIDTQDLENGRVREDHWSKIVKACGELSESNIYIDDSGTQTDMDIWTKAKRHKAKYGLDMIIVDYLQLVKSSKDVKSRQLEVGEISRNFKKITKDLNVPVLALAQLSRSCEQEKRKPRLSDLREAGDIEQDADVVMFLHYPHALKDDKPKDLMEVIFAKHRGGKKGYVELNWRPDITKFSEYL